MTSGVYIAWCSWLDIEYGKGNLFKIGHSGNLANRLNNDCYVTCFLPNSWKYQHTFETANKEDAFLLETAVLHCCRHHRIGTRELVRMRLEEIVKVVLTVADTLKIKMNRRDSPTYAPPAKVGGSASGDKQHEPHDTPPARWAASRPLVEGFTVAPIVQDADIVDEILSWDFSALTIAPKIEPMKVIAPKVEPPKPIVKLAAPKQAEEPKAGDVDVLIDEFADIAAIEDSPFDLAANTQLEMREYQRDAITRCVAELRASNRAILQMACRCGKTSVAFGIIREYLRPGASRALTDPVCALYLVPGLALLRQTAQKLASYGFAEPMLLVGSDARPVMVHVSGATQPKELAMTTDPAVIRAFVAERGCRLVISTYQSSPQVPNDVFEITIFDESHRVCGGDAPRPFNHIISAPVVGARLFMTATPSYDRTAITMKTKETFGGVAYRYHLRAGIAAGYVNDFRLEVVAGELPPEGHDQTPDEYTIPRQILVAMAKVDKLLVFCRDIRHSERLCAALKALPPTNGVKPFTCLVAHSRMPNAATGGIAKVLREFSEPGQRAVLFNCRLFQEGVEIPALNAVFFAAPRHSPRDIIQSLCRPLNKTPGKPTSIIFLPVLHDPAKAPDDPANLKRYATIVPFVDALLDEDPRLYEHLLDPIGKPYPIEALGTHALGLTDVKKRAVLLNAVRRAVRYGGSTAARPVDRILRVGSVPWEWVYEQIKYTVEKCNRYPKTGEAALIGGQKVSFHRFYRWAADEYTAYKAGKTSKLEPHQVCDLEKLPQWTLYGVEGPYPQKLCLEFLEQFLQEQGVEHLILNIQNGGYIGLEATAMERLSGLATCYNQADGKLRNGKPGTGFTLSIEKQEAMDRVCKKFGLRWRKEREENGELVEGGPKTFIQEAYDRFKNYVKAHGADSELIQRWYPGFPRKHANMDRDEVVEGKLALPKMKTGRRPQMKKE